MHNLIFSDILNISGDAIFFHSNLLHHSSANRSDMRRWAYLISYNTKSNDPVIEHHHASYTPLDKV
jgi:ectoine hydroxylase-related dioxygenase (phytanoyl-CoA dioxygenase family)